MPFRPVIGSTAGGVSFLIRQGTPASSGASAPVIDSDPPTMTGAALDPSEVLFSDTTALINVNFTDALTEVDAQNARALEATLPGITGTIPLTPTNLPANGGTVSVGYLATLPSGQTFASATSTTLSITVPTGGGVSDTGGNDLAVTETANATIPVANPLSTFQVIPVVDGRLPGSGEWDSVQFEGTVTTTATIVNYEVGYRGVGDASYTNSNVASLPGSVASPTTNAFNTHIEGQARPLYASAATDYLTDVGRVKFLNYASSASVNNTLSPQERAVADDGTYLWFAPMQDTMLRRLNKATGVFESFSISDTTSNTKALSIHLSSDGVYGFIPPTILRDSNAAERNKVARFNLSTGVVDFPGTQLTTDNQATYTRFAIQDPADTARWWLVPSGGVTVTARFTELNTNTFVTTAVGSTYNETAFFTAIVDPADSTHFWAIPFRHSSLLKVRFSDGNESSTVAHGLTSSRLFREVYSDGVDTLFMFGDVGFYVFNTTTEVLTAVDTSSNYFLRNGQLNSTTLIYGDATNIYVYDHGTQTVSQTIPHGLGVSVGAFFPNQTNTNEVAFVTSAGVYVVDLTTSAITQEMVWTNVNGNINGYLDAANNHIYYFNQGTNNGIARLEF